MYVFGKALYSQTLHLLAEVPPGAEDQMPDPTQDRTLHKMEEEDVQLPDLPGKDICRFGILQHQVLVMSLQQCFPNVAVWHNGAP